MKYRIEPDRLIMTVDAIEQANLKNYRVQNPEIFHTEAVMNDVLEPLVTNDCFFWLPEDLCGDLTTAPVIAFLGDEEDAPEDYFYNKPGSGLYSVGQNGDGHQVMPVIYRWCFMNYQVTTVQDELADKGECIWQGGDFIHREGQMALSCVEGMASLKHPF